MYEDQLVWSGIEQDDMSNIYGYLKELALNHINAESESTSNSPKYNKTFHEKVSSRILAIKALCLNTSFVDLNFCVYLFKNLNYFKNDLDL